jgi:hypothetical protein
LAREFTNGAREFTLGGRVHHAYRLRPTPEAARGAGLLLASLAQPRPKILTPKSLPGSMRATTPSVVIWAPVTPSARDSSSKDGASARAVGSLGRYDYWGTLFGGGSDLSTTFDGEASNGATLLGYQVHTPAITPIR